MKLIVQFSVENFRSIRELKTLSMAATSIKDDVADLIGKNSQKYLPSVAIYGANSSGKSNLIRSMAMMGKMVLESVKLNDDDNLPYAPYEYNTESVTQPTMFELVFVLGTTIYRYGFEYNKKAILGEWLYAKKGKGESPLFLRTVEGIGVDAAIFAEGEGLENKTNNNRLFLSVVAQLGGQLSKKIIRFFLSGYNVISGLDTDVYETYTKKMLLEKDEIAEKILSMCQSLALGFENVVAFTKDFDMSSLPDKMPTELKAELAKQLTGKKSLKAQSIHPIYDANGVLVDHKKFDFAEYESEGTIKLFGLSGPIFDTLRDGAVLIVDELDAKMHPLISQYLVRLFNSSSTNPKGAQLIFNTHDTHLLSSKLLRRDQIWFTEKNDKGETDVYRLMDVVMPNNQAPRNDSNLEKNYIAGRYGAIPYIKD